MQTVLGTLETPRLRLAPPVLADDKLFCQIQADPKVMRYMGRGIRSVESSYVFFMDNMQHQIRKGLSMHTVYEKNLQKYIGIAGLFHFNMIETDPRIEIAFALLPDYWRQGYGHEIVKAFVTWGQIHRSPTIVAMVNPQNRGSITLLEHHGFKFKNMSAREGQPAGYYENTSSRPSFLQPLT